MTGENRKELALIIGLLAVIVAAGVWVTRSLLKPDFNVKLHQGIGQALADETEKLLQDKGSIVLITLRPKKSPVLDVQIAAFQKSLARRGGISAVQTVILNSEPRKASPGMGLSSEEFLTIFEKHAHTDVIVSFVGTPDPRDPKIGGIGKVAGPKVVAETRTRGKIKTLFRNQLLHAAVVPRFQFPAPGSSKPSTAREWFDLTYQVIHADTKEPPEEKK